eukprot:CAMPEP_0171300098 /NCGR_PEP_ID=MMETSP0816-20121228/8923_1 /TAXON_ID=420281 /ORGANISM="Proboscia inermis, Strain CCAP1064/1" /LENGTH=338 /DNA_ID=CAMNT_0011776371 /DNA_START=9 /DNA_END=1026 /DNA_ORIENTATION=-
MALALKGDTHFRDGPGTGRLFTSVNPVYITPTSKMVVEYTGMKCQPHKAIVGANAFQHESGIHQDGMIKNKGTYEIMTPESIGLMRGDSQSGAGIVLGKHSGRNAVSTRLRELGYTLDTDKFNAFFGRFKQIAEKKKGGFEDEELEALVTDQYGVYNTYWEVTGFQVYDWYGWDPHGNGYIGRTRWCRGYTAKTGTGPVDAVYKAIDEIIGVNVDLLTYSMDAVNAGIDALAIARVSLSPAPSKMGDFSSASIDPNFGQKKERAFSGSGSCTDIIVSSARAYTSALNKMLSWNNIRRGDGANASGSKTPESMSVNGVSAMGNKPQEMIIASGSKITEI